MKLETKAIFLASIIALISAIVKIVAGFLSSSILLINSAVDSFFDSFVSFLNLFVLKKSSQSPDSTFNFGYSKLESLAAFTQGLIISCIGIFLFYQSIMKLVQNNHNLDIEISIFAMLFSLFFTAIIVFLLYYAFKKTDNLVVKTDMQHYKGDLVANLAVLLAFVFISFTNLYIFDSLFGILASCYIIYSAFLLIKQSSYMLLDGSIDEKILCEVVQLILQREEVLSLHDVKSRQSGNRYFLSYHVVFNKTLSLNEAHDISDEIENLIKEKFKFNWDIDVHFDYFDDSN
ncbi:cation diffusion facilitator family transporter [Campylobacter pinnipediorum subsp. pinnipediorum]|uniref:cation diffusion facilitator family transporter n=1 Tax=Campylobacter pinnipediorum TaxID=1965231 RepID=UPI0009957433|nr:cation diffusion facilitator family transporter [Campylobacter pinnipediorum]AQW81299.1 cation diffusion facilitator family transporter [Campylobacter pinnipediorum subsp. pinnipediorum]